MKPVGMVAKLYAISAGPNIHLHQLIADLDLQILMRSKIPYLRPFQTNILFLEKTTFNQQNSR